jgi:phage FluMu protein Com
MMIAIRCEHCQHLLCRVSKDYFGVVQVKCRHCKRLNNVSVAMILKQMSQADRDRVTLTPPS